MVSRLSGVWDLKGGLKPQEICDSSGSRRDFFRVFQHFMVVLV